MFKFFRVKILSINRQLHLHLLESTQLTNEYRLNTPSVRGPYSRTISCPEENAVKMIE